MSNMDFLNTKMTAKQRRFCEEYLTDLNGTQAAIRAGYSSKSSYSQANRLLKNAEIKKYIDHLMVDRSKQLSLSARQVVDDHIAIRNMKVSDILDDSLHIKPVSEWPDIWQMYVSGVDIKEAFESGKSAGEVTMTVLKKLKWPDKLKNLELLGKHFGIFEKDNLQRRPPVEQMTEAEIDAELAAIESEFAIYGIN